MQKNKNPTPKGKDQSITLISEKYKLHSKNDECILLHSSLKKNNENQHKEKTNGKQIEKLKL